MTMLLQLVYDTVQKYGKGKCDTGFDCAVLFGCGYKTGKDSK